MLSALELPAARHTDSVDIQYLLLLHIADSTLKGDLSGAGSGNQWPCYPPM